MVYPIYYLFLFFGLVFILSKNFISFDTLGIAQDAFYFKLELLKKMLFDSYEIKIGDLRIDILTKMVLAQDQRLRQVWAARDANTPVKSIDALLVLASIIEKETGVSDERFQVASVFANRLEQGMPLQTDPTVIYGITMGKGPLGRGLRKSELRRDTPWNTYLNRGLPPTAIASPGIASLEAALNPAETDYIFFVADGSGGHAFAVTLKEHNRNVEAWRKIEAERNK